MLTFCDQNWTFKITIIIITKNVPQGLAPWFWVRFWADFVIDQPEDLKGGGTWTNPPPHVSDDEDENDDDDDDDNDDNNNNNNDDENVCPSKLTPIPSVFPF